MNSKRPIIEIPKRSIDKMLDLLGFGAILFMFLFGAFSYADLPDSIPTKFGYDVNQHNGARNQCCGCYQL